MASEYQRLCEELRLHLRAVAKIRSKLKTKTVTRISTDGSKYEQAIPIDETGMQIALPGEGFLVDKNNTIWTLRCGATYSGVELVKHEDTAGSDIKGC